YDVSSPLTLAVTVHSFRLRHGATKYFFGGLSGNDHIAADAVVTENGRTILATTVAESGGNGNPFAISRDSRGGNRLNAVSILVTKYLLTTTPNAPGSAPGGGA